MRTGSVQRKVRAIAIALLVVILGIAALVLILRHRTDSAPLENERYLNTTGNTHVEDLRRRAKLGDDAARFELHLFVGDTDESRAMLDAATRSGYGPAVALSLRRAFDSKDLQRQSLALKRAEETARGGSLAASIALSYCKWSSECGEASLTDAYRWAALAAHIANQLPSKETGPEDERRRIAALVDRAKRDAIESEVKSLTRAASFRARA